MANHRDRLAGLYQQKQAGIERIVITLTWDLLTPIQASEALGITKAKLTALRRSIYGPKYIKVGGKYRYFKEDLTKWSNKYKDQTVKGGI